MTDFASQYITQAFKDYKWYNSHSLNIEEVQCSICRIELPSFLNIATDFPEDIYVTAYVSCNQIPIHESPISTHFATRDTSKNCWVWDYVLSFPIKFRELSRNAAISITAWSHDGTPLGGTSMSFFDENGCLRQGKQKLLFPFGKVADATVAKGKNPLSMNTCDDSEIEDYCEYKSHDNSFTTEKVLEQFKNTPAESKKMEWLDRLTLQQIQNTLGHALVPNVNVDGTDDDAVRWGCSPKECELLKKCCIVIEMPLLPLPVIYDERTYASVPSHNPSVASTIANSGCVTENDRGILEFSIVGKSFVASSLNITTDWELEHGNIFEEHYRHLAHDILRGGAGDAQIKPNKNEREQIDRILAAVESNLEFDEKDLLYRFRYVLTDNKKALTKFLLSVDWTVEAEVEETQLLLNQWKVKSPIDVADALKLLGREKAFQSNFVREYAVEVLHKATDEELRIFLLQLVQALRYDPRSEDTPRPKSTAADGSMSQQPTANLSPLAKFLIDRACNSTYLANYLYWYLKVEIDDESLGAMFKDVYETFLTQLKSCSSTDGSRTHSDGLKTALQLEALDEYVCSIIRCQRLAREEKGKKEPKEQCFRKLLVDQQLTSVPERVPYVPMPLDPRISLVGLNASSSFMFASATYPAVIEFYTTQFVADVFEDSDAPPQAPEEESDSEAVMLPPVPPPSAAKRPSYKVVFKSGDDLRQDQLIMQMFDLMDSLLKNVNLDLKLLTYGILATGPKDGIMEFVVGSIPVSGVLNTYKTIGAYLRHVAPDKNEPLGISAVCMDTFVKSCAGSCVVTYILGIGDRHLDNLMMVPTGQLFHIDFGFIFGRDPKPFPPPFRFTRPMIDAMGGEESEHYGKFKTYCCQAYNWLRKSASLILNLLSLMGDAGIPDMSVHSNLSTVLTNIQVKFRLDLTDELAEQYFLSLINESVNAIAPRIMELAHQIAVSRR